jgi:hypothetical protein
MKNIQEIISNIQEKIFDKNDQNFFLEYSEFGYVQAVKLHLQIYSMNIQVDLWNSENEEREWIEEINDYEDFEVFLKRKIEEILMSFTELKSILINEKD